LERPHAVSAAVRALRPRQAYAYSATTANVPRALELLATINNISSAATRPCGEREDGKLYISGSRERRRPGAGPFHRAGFVIDLRQHLASPLTEGPDKPWMAVDSTSGNVYITWTSFPQDLASRILMQRLDADLNPLGPVQELRFTPAGADYACQLSYPAVGPDGVLYVAWDIYYFNTITNDLTLPVSHYEIRPLRRRGQTFVRSTRSPDHSWNITALSPGNPRGIWAGVIALAIDNTHGPHRGRVYASWATLPSFQTRCPQARPCRRSRTTTSLPPPCRSRRAAGFTGNTGANGDDDFFKFTGQRGQVLRIWPDTLNNQAHPHHLSRGYLDLRELPLHRPGLCAVHLRARVRRHFTTSRSRRPATQPGGYQIATVVDRAPPGDPTRDIRDPSLSWSTTRRLSTAVRLNDDDPAPIAPRPGLVDGRGRVHSFCSTGATISCAA